MPHWRREACSCAVHDLRGRRRRVRVLLGPRVRHCATAIPQQPPPHERHKAHRAGGRDRLRCTRRVGGIQRSGLPVADAHIVRSERPRASAALQADRRVISAADGDRLPRCPPRRGDAERAAHAPVARAQGQDQASTLPGLRHGEVTRAVGQRLVAFRCRLTDGPAQSLPIHYR